LTYCRRPSPVKNQKPLKSTLKKTPSSDLTNTKALRESNDSEDEDSREEKNVDEGGDEKNKALIAGKTQRRTSFADIGGGSGSRRASISELSALTTPSSRRGSIAEIPPTSPSLSRRASLASTGGVSFALSIGENSGVGSEQRATEDPSSSTARPVESVAETVVRLGHPDDIGTIYIVKPHKTRGFRKWTLSRKVFIGQQK
jgi:hypothetical protein